MTGRNSDKGEVREKGKKGQNQSEITVFTINVQTCSDADNMAELFLTSA